VAKERFGGFNLEFNVNSGYVFGVAGDQRGPYIGVTIPLYSKKDRLTYSHQATQFLQQGADLIAKLEEAEKTLQIKRHAMRFMQARMGEEGSQGGKLYFEELVNLAHQEALITQYHRQLRSLIDPLKGHVETNSENFMRSQ
jgi:hypothetical protein